MAVAAWDSRSSSLMGRARPIHPQNSALRDFRRDVYGHFLDFPPVFACFLPFHRRVWSNVPPAVRKPGLKNHWKSIFTNSVQLVVYFDVILFVYIATGALHDGRMVAAVDVCVYDWRT